MRLRFLRLCVASLAVAGFLNLAPQASADTVDSLSLTLSPSLPGNGNGVNGGVPFTWTQNTPTNTHFAQAITTYCADVKDGIRNGTFTTHTDIKAIPNITTANEGAIRTLFDHFYSSSFHSSGSYSASTNEAAFQLALWELIYDGATSPDLGSGTITAAAGSDVRNDAAAMLSGASWNGTEHDLANASLIALVPNDTTYTAKRNQDQLMVVPKGVPAPPAVMLAGIGMLALLGRARWTRKGTPGTPVA